MRASPTSRPVAGAFEGIEGRTAYGWVASFADQRPIGVELLVDGLPVATCLSGQLRPDVAKKAGAPNECGFRLGVTEDISSNPARVSIRIAGTNTLIGRSKHFRVEPVSTSLKRTAGLVTAVHGLTLSGRAVDPAKPKTPAEVEFFVDGKKNRRAVANLSTAVVDGNVHASRCGFRQSLDVVFQGDEERVVSVRFADGTEFANSPFAVRPPTEDVAAEQKRIEKSGLPKLTFAECDLGYCQIDEKGFQEQYSEWRTIFRALHTFAVANGLHPDVISLISPQGMSVRPFEMPAKYCTPHSEIGETIIGTAGPFADCWFVSDFSIRFRSRAVLETGAPPGISISFYQQRLADRKLVRTGRMQLAHDAPVFCDVRLLNPYLPLLVISADEYERVVGATIIPFPSLIRGGAHHGELLAVCPSQNHLAGLHELSVSVLGESFGWRDIDSPFSLKTIVVDMRAATGAERIFSTAAKEWLSHHLGLDFELTRTDEFTERRDHDFLHSLEAIEPLAEGTPSSSLALARQAAPLRLTLPSDALPSLNVVLSRRLANDQEQLGSYVVCDQRSGNPMLSVLLPHQLPWILPLQPPSAPLLGPVVQPIDNSVGSPKVERIGAAYPFAIRFQPPPTVNEAALLFPVAVNEPLLVRGLSANPDGKARISVLLTPESGVQCFSLVRSLASQTVNPLIEIIAVPCSKEEGFLRNLKELLDEHFGGRYVIEPRKERRADRLNIAAKSARGEFYFVANDSVCLHDVRTLETLCLLAGTENVATSSCVVLNEKPSRKDTVVSVHSGGLFPSSISLSGAPSIVFKEITTASAFPLATYPVVANSFRVAAVRAKAWTAMSGLNTTLFPIAEYDLDFSLRALEDGWVHLCTSAVCALDVDDFAPKGRPDINALDYLPLTRWQTVLEKSALIRELN
jgi:hypothetical protein